MPRLSARGDGVPEALRFSSQKIRFTEQKIIANMNDIFYVHAQKQPKTEK